MANPIRRIIELVTDRAAAARAEAEGKKALGGIEGSVNKTRSAVLKLGAALVSAFTGAKILQFLRSTIAEANSAEVAWNDLRAAVDAAGGSFAAISSDLRGLAAGFQGSTLLTDDDFAMGLTRLITLTGDVGASINNMGLVANVATAFFNGDLKPAVELVAKVMVGYTTVLQRMGIQVSSAQEGLDVLAERSMGKAQASTETLSGAVTQLANDWGDFKEAIGNAIVSSEEMGDQADRVATLLRRMTAAVDDNRGGLRSFVTGGIEFVVQGLDALLRVAFAVAQFFAGSVLSVMGAATKIFANLGIGATLAVQGMAKLASFVGASSIADDLDEFAARVERVRKGISDFADTALAAGTGLGADAFRQFTRTLIPTTADPRPKLQAAAPTPAKGGGGDGEDGAAVADPITNAIAEFGRAEQEADALANLLQDDFDRVAARVANLQQVINALVSAGVSPADDALRGYAEQLQLLLPRTDRVAEVQANLDERFRVSATLANVLGDEYDVTGDQINALQSAMIELAEIGTPAADAALETTGERLRELEEAVRLTQKGFDDAAAAGQLFGDVVGAALGVGLGPMAAAKAKENLILAAEATAKGIALALNPFTAGKAAAMFALAGRHTAIAAAWGGLAATFGGAGGGSGAGGVAGAQGASNAAAQNAAAPAPDVTVILEGAGFDAMNPVVQNVVLGAIDAGRERVGANTNVKIIRRR